MSYALFAKAAEEFLRSQNTSANDSRSAKQIIENVGKNNPEIALAANTQLAYLSKLAQDPGYQVRSGGFRGAGYWFEQAQPLPDKANEQKPSETLKVGQTQLREEDLYPLMKLWLATKGFIAEDTSKLKKGGKWGNPDILGIERSELFGAVEIQLVSCEIKLSATDWERWIFEAISHKRFCNRSWFCYRARSEEEPPAEMLYYSERYRVGIVQIILSDEELEALKKSKEVDLDLIQKVFEVVPALYDHVPLKEQVDLVDRTGIRLTLSFG